MGKHVKFSRYAVVAAAVATSMAFGYGTAYADPSPPKPSKIDYSLRLVDKTVVFSVTGGTIDLTNQNRFFEIRNPAGKPVFSMPVDFSVGDRKVPVRPVVKNHTTLELTPQKIDLPPNITIAGINSTVKPVASPMENDQAFATFLSEFGIAMQIGGFLGTAIGLVVGGILGCIVGLPLAGLGCIPAAIAGATLGGFLGTLAVGGPVLAITSQELLQTLQAPPGKSKYANYGRPS